MSDDDRLMSSLTAQRAERTLEDGCGNCGFSKVYCRCVTYIDGSDARCCPTCTH